MLSGIVLTCLPATLFVHLSASYLYWSLYHTNTWHIWTEALQCGFILSYQIPIIPLFTRDSCTGRYCWERILAMGILSVCVSPPLTTRHWFTATWDRDSGSSPYDSLEYLVSYEVMWCHWVQRFPSNKGIKEGYPLEIVILPLMAHLAWKRLQIDTDLLLIITSTANELSSGTNIDDLEPQKYGF